MSNNCSSAGVSIANETEAKEVYAAVRYGKTKWCTFKNSNESTWTLDHSFSKPDATSDEAWDHLLAILPSKECCFVLYNFDYVSQSDKVSRTKLVMINWAPDEAGVKDKMLAAMNAKSIKGKFGSWGGSIFMTIQAGCLASLEKQEVEKKITSRCTVN